ncbi:hypothetical protein [Phenylobacterium sp.]|uniref:hypothetical protein n=1 Tax=Phenylobacterium sp. TaxID=1871053 RepID=UPI0035B3C350
MPTTPKERAAFYLRQAGRFDRLAAAAKLPLRRAQYLQLADECRFLAERFEALAQASDATPPPRPDP